MLIFPADDYGAIAETAKSAGLMSRPRFFGSELEWQHGSIPYEYNFSPELIIDSDGHAYERREFTFLVARKDQVEALHRMGFEKAKAIGLPFVYAAKRFASRGESARRQGSLLAMPAHSNRSWSEGWDFDSHYASTLKSLYGQFREIVVCLHGADFDNGRADFYRRAGFSVIKGADEGDSTSLYRLALYFSSFEYVTTNSWGSHVFYAGALGAKVSIHGPFEERSDSVKIKSSVKFANIAHILPEVRRANQEVWDRLQKKGFVTEPVNAEQHVDYCRVEIGWENTLSPGELRELFGWRDDFYVLFNNLLKPFRKIARRLKKWNVLRLKVGAVRKSAGKELPFRFLDTLKHFVEALVWLFTPPDEFLVATGSGTSLRIRTDEASIANAEFHLISGGYKAILENPYASVLEIGSYCGLSALQIQLSWPTARYFGLEPNPSSYEIAVHNTSGLRGVEIQNLALCDDSRGAALHLPPSGHMFARVLPTGSSMGSIRTTSLRELVGSSAKGPWELLVIDAAGVDMQLLENRLDVIASNFVALIVKFHQPEYSDARISRLKFQISEAFEREPVFKEGWWVWEKTNNRGGSADGKRTKPC